MIIKAGTTYPSRAPGFTSGFWRVRVAHAVVLCCIFVCLCSVSCVPNVASVYGLSILHVTFGLLKYFWSKKTKEPTQNSQNLLACVFMRKVHLSCNK